MSPASTSAGSPTIPKISFHDPPENRRLSSSNSRRLSRGSSGAIEEDSDEDHAQDWSVKVPDEETWAAKERRRSSVWNKVNNYPSVKPKTPTGSFSSKEKAGSILSLWAHGKDKHGNDVLHSGENVEHWDGNAAEIERLAAEKAAEKERIKKLKLEQIQNMELEAERIRKEAERLRAETFELDKADIEVVQVEQVPPPVLDIGLKPRRSEGRKGSVLGIWKGGKDEHGNDVIHSG